MHELFLGKLKECQIYFAEFDKIYCKFNCFKHQYVHQISLLI